MFLRFFKKKKYKEREKELNQFVLRTKSILKNLIKKERNSSLKELFEDMLFRLNNSNWRIISGKKAFIKRSNNFLEIITGETIKYFHGFKPVHSEIVFPEKHIFKGNKLTNDGKMTIWHELAHLASKDPIALSSFKKTYKVSYEQAHELISDFSSLKIALAYGIPKTIIYSHLFPRSFLFPNVPFMTFVIKLINKKR